MKRIASCLLAALAIALPVGLPACTKQTPRDVGNQNPRSEFVEGPGGRPDASSPSEAAGAKDGGRALASPSATDGRPRELANASSRALATSPTHVYFGDAEDDALYVVPKRGGQPTRLARHAPTPNALSLDVGDPPGILVWIGSPGDVVLRMSARGGPVTTLRDQSLFTDVAATGGEVFTTEAHGSAGDLTRVDTRGALARIATVEGSPRGIVADAQNVYVATTLRLVSVPRGGHVKAVLILANGAGFSSPQVEGTWLYATAMDPASRRRVVVRVATSGIDPVGGAPAFETVARNVRDAPIALHRGTLYWLDADRPVLNATSFPPSRTTPTATTVVAEDGRFEHASAIVVDDDGVYLATGYGEGARVLAIP